jgi:HPt (histidine-containing phosphotransfer) domain-containing protein
VNEVPGESTEELRELREQFALRLPARLTEIEDSWQRAGDSGWSAEPLRLLFRLTHSLSGAAATFGFPEVATAAASLESLLQEVMAAARPPGAEKARSIADLLDELHRVSSPPPSRTAPP